MLRILLVFSILFINLYALKPSVSEESWESGVSLLRFFEKNSIPVSLFYSLPQEDKELAAEIVAGTKYQILHRKNGEVSQILIPVSDELQIHIFRDSEDIFRLEFVPIAYQSEDRVDVVEITRSVTQDIHESTGSIGLAFAFRDAFKSEKKINFNKVQKGDKAVIVYSQKIRMGRVFGTPEIHSASFETGNKSYKVYKYENKFYDKNGKQSDKFFLTRPISNARITSGFTLKRYHPVLRRYRAHLGVDYGAPRGTPIRSAGDGVVKFVGNKNGYGKTLIISHAGGYETLYAHLNGFAKGISVGKKVKQGTHVAFVGSSGMSTGPHLHFGLYINNKPINPESMLKVVKPAMDKKETAVFKGIVDKNNALIKKALDSGKILQKAETFPDVVKVEF
ncbi:peptidoglycan DD-metalloendopeptidase family protein [Campylobacter suis]|uniref:Zinc metallopeptidase, M23 family n=1 Tax=Campylobacter suis TaxID=2790657 RepID=A0ABM8Q3C1_9BACT|nr:peptidoglycan DD-metalloendopeptidase family protein [Campylobacter suis]CAD7287327.1 hypothetical protein LMG8286_00934 [Campylobacter suis]